MFHNPGLQFCFRDCIYLNKLTKRRKRANAIKHLNRFIIKKWQQELNFNTNNNIKWGEN